MKQLLSTYSISGNVVTLTGVNRPREAILLIADATTGTVLYSAATGGASAYTQSANSTITLTTTPGASDRLQIFYDDGVAVSNAPSSVSISGTVPVSGTFWQTTQPVSLSSLPALATGANTIGAVNVNGTVPVSGTFWQATQPVSLTSLPALAAGSSLIGKTTLQSGAKGTSTAADVTSTNVDANTQALDVSLKSALPTGTNNIGKVDVNTLPALAAGSNTIGSVNVLGGNATAVKVDGSAVTQPVSGTVTANPASSSFTDKSGTITTGGQAQAISITGLTKFFVIVNNSSSAMYLAVGTTASATNGIYLAPNGGGYEFPFMPTNNLSIFCATTGAAFTAYGA